MTIKAILHNGQIEPLEPIPQEWAEGQELLKDQPETAVDQAQLAKWAEQMELAASIIPLEEHERFQRAMDEIERESKDSVRREWGIP